jgi:isoquinoline 1-oxidoreductase alpha subunit
MREMATVGLEVNGSEVAVDVPEDMPLLWVLRDVLRLKGAKYGCGIAQCGACTVHVDGEARRSCVTPIGSVAGARVTTIEGVPPEHPVKRAWAAEDVPQCGYCQPGQIMGAIALLARTPRPDDATIDGAMRGHLCRCGTYPRIRRAIHRAGESSR